MSSGLGIDPHSASTNGSAAALGVEGMFKQIMDVVAKSVSIRTLEARRSRAS